jgi:hypothetical protein
MIALAETKQKNCDWRRSENRSQEKTKISTTNKLLLKRRRGGKRRRGSWQEF